MKKQKEKKPGYYLKAYVLSEKCTVNSSLLVERYLFSTTFLAGLILTQPTVPI
jgi:hypothetical protein